MWCPARPANAYIFTLTPTGTDGITFSLVAEEECASRGVCTADGTMLTEVPVALELASDLPPTIDSAADLDVEEATTAVTMLAASDPDTSASHLVWSIPEGAAGGADADKFALSTAGVLTLLAAKDFEAPDDADGDGTYEVTVQVDDTASQVTADLRVRLTDVNEAPVVSGPRTASHEENDSDSVGFYTATDPDRDAVEWSLSGPDEALFTIVGGVLRFGAPPDFEGPGDNEYRVVVEATDGDPDNMLTGTLAVTVNVIGVNEAPVVSGPRTASHEENDSDSVGFYTATDPDRDAVEWSLSGPDEALFTIVGGVLRFGAPPDFEGPGDNEYRVVVEATDGDLVGTAAVTVYVINDDEPEAASLSPSEPEVDRGVAASVADPDGIVSAVLWRWERSTNRSSWNLIDGEASAVYTPGAGDVGHWLRATASYTDGHGSAKQAAAVSGAAVVPSTTNDPPVFPATETGARRVAENTPAGRNIGEPVAADDPGDRLTYTIAGPDAALFQIVPTSGQLRTSGELDYEREDSLAVVVTATDGGGASASQRVTVTVTDIDEAPKVSGRALVRYPENETYEVADYTADDPENQPVEWSLSGPDAAHFNIDPSSGRLSFATPPDHEARRNLYEVIVHATDTTDNTGPLAVTINVTDTDEPPIVTGDAAPSHPKLSTAPVGTYRADDPEEHSAQWSLSGPDADDFSIDNRGTLSFATPPDEEGSLYEIIVDAYDGKLTGSLDVTITVIATQPFSATGGGGGGGGASTAVVIVANGWSPADIGVAAALSARTAGSAVVYTAGDRLSVAARELLVDQLPAGVIVVGGEAAVSDAALVSVRLASESGSVERITGATRADTAAGVARRILDAAEAGGTTMIIANGHSPADIGVAAALSARMPRSAVAYVTAGALPDATRRLLGDYRPGASGHRRRHRRGPSRCGIGNPCDGARRCHRARQRNHTFWNRRRGRSTLLGSTPSRRDRRAHCHRGKRVEPARRRRRSGAVGAHRGFSGALHRSGTAVRRSRRGAARLPAGTDRVHRRDIRDHQPSQRTSPRHRARRSRAALQRIHTHSNSGIRGPPHPRKPLGRWSAIGVRPRLQASDLRFRVHQTPKRRLSDHPPRRVVGNWGLVGRRPGRSPTAARRLFPRAQKAGQFLR